MEQNHPVLIQGGMGIGVSGWKLAREVAKTGCMGVVSGTAIGHAVARYLERGDIGGHIRRALDHFPIRDMARRVVDRYFDPKGKAFGERLRHIPLFTQNPNQELVDLTICANFAEVWLAKEGHNGPVGINFLEKVQMPHLLSIYGAMLANVDYVLMGAGIPTQVPGVLDRLAQHEPASYRLSVEGSSSDDDYRMVFEPRGVIGKDAPPLKRPYFLAIVSSVTLASMLLSKASGTVNGFIVEGPTAGGHNAPPRGKPQLNDRGEPIYGERDRVDWAKMKDLGAPFWIAGAYASRDKLEAAIAAGAVGIQAGTIFALCEESGLMMEYKRALRRQAFTGQTDVRTDPRASSSGFPFKVANMPGTLADTDVYEDRPRICDVGYLRSVYKKADGALGYRCSAEPEAIYIAKGGRPEDTEGRKCLCNALLADIGLPQLQPKNYLEQPLITMGDDVSFIRCLMTSEDDTYTAQDAVNYILHGTCLAGP